MPVSEILAAVAYGPYISWWKVLVLVVVIFIWAKLLAWADKDALRAHLPRAALNSGMLGGLIVAFALFMFIPGFTAAISVFAFLFVAEIVAYLLIRNQKAGLADLKKQISKSMGGKKAAKAAEAAPGDVQLLNKKGSPFLPPDSESPDQAAYVAVQSMLADPMRRNAERIEMRPSDGAASVKYSVDGVMLDGRSVARDDAAAAVQLLKQLAGMDVNDRRKPQSGTMKTVLNGAKKELQVNTAGSNAGETISIDVEPKKRYELTIDQLGLFPEQLNTVEEIIADGQGIVIVAAPKGHGMTSMMYALLRRHDAFLSMIQTLERDPQIDLEGITQTKLTSGAGEEAKQVAWLSSQQPDILMVDRLEEPKSAQEVANFAETTGKRAYIGIRAGSTFEALQIWRNLVGDDKAAMKNVRLVIAGRLMRRLCNACKQDFNPDPDTLRKMNMSPERVGKLFTARTSPLKDNRGRDMVCDFCLDLRFKGRLGVFELFIVDDEVKQVIQAGGSVNQLKMLFKKQRQKYLQEQALAVAVSGESSLNEVARVLKPTDGSSGGGGGGGSSSSGRKSTSAR